MKVAFIGNTNNVFFCIVRYLRDMGIEADLLLMDCESAHFSPSADTFDLSYQKYTKQLNWGTPFNYSKTSAQNIKNDLKDYDFLVGQGGAPAFLEKASMALDIFVPYGIDFYSWPFFSIVNPQYIFAWKQFTAAQKRGIYKAKYFQFDLSNEMNEKIIAGIIGGERLTVGVPMIYTPEYSLEKMEINCNKTHWGHEFKAMKETCDLLVFHHSRLCWTMTDIHSNKGSDLFLRGFASFCHNNPDVNMKVAMLEYGPDVPVAKKLIHDLKIENKVKWFPLMSRKDLMVGLHYADIGTSGEFKRSYISCGTIYENLAVGNLMLHRRDDSLYKAYEELYPILNITHEEGVIKQLEYFVNNEKLCRGLGLKGHQWLENYVIKPSLAKYIELMNQ